MKCGRLVAVSALSGGCSEQNTSGCANSGDEQRAEVRMQGVNSAYMMP